LRGGHSCNLEVDRRLGQHAAVQGGFSFEQSVGLDQEDALHVGPFVHHYLAGDLPEDVLSQCTIRQDHGCVCRLEQTAPHLNYEDVGGAAIKIDIRGDGDVSIKSVDTSCQWIGYAASEATEDSCSEIDSRGIIVRARLNVVVRGLHVKDCNRQLCLCDPDIIRREGLACAMELRRC
jgi:hypothetical protein